MSSTLVSSLACVFASLLCAPELHIEVECFEREQEQMKGDTERGVEIALFIKLKIIILVTKQDEDADADADDAQDQFTAGGTSEALLAALLD